MHYSLWIKTQVENSISSALLAAVFLVYIYVSRDWSQYAWLLLHNSYVITKMAIFNFWNEIDRNKNVLAQMNGRLGRCNLGIFDSGKLFLDRTLPLSHLNFITKNHFYLLKWLLQFSNHTGLTLLLASLLFLLLVPEHKVISGRISKINRVADEMFIVVSWWAVDNMQKWPERKFTIWSANWNAQNTYMIFLCHTNTLNLCLFTLCYFFPKIEEEMSFVNIINI